ncbi:unnamed protein product [Chrysodeixis includens]|uniref:Uncharacterized protein n=1 Tax=Chrysodeixis includens TaxID=689277 RepID=A0A9N8KYX9_CHRIL|nr:unnamed protein product [Chrysodeixis includens]
MAPTNNERELPATDAHPLPRSSRNSKRIRNFNQGAVELLDNGKKGYLENVEMRKANTRNQIPVYIITRSKPIGRTGSTDDVNDDLFDENGMVYITKPKKAKKEVEYIDFNGRRTYDLSKRNRRKLMAMMNQELNRQLLKKTNGVRRGFEVDFTDLVV